MKIIRETNKYYANFAALRKIIKSLKWYGYEREGMTTYTFRTSQSMYIVHLIKV